MKFYQIKQVKGCVHGGKCVGKIGKYVGKLNPKYRHELVHVIQFPSKIPSCSNILCQFSMWELEEVSSSIEWLPEGYLPPELDMVK